MVILDSLESGLKTAVARTELTSTEQNTLALLYETLIARHEPEPGDDRRVMQTSAQDVSLVLHALVVINKMEPDERSAVRLFLRLLETPLVNLALGRSQRILTRIDMSFGQRPRCPLLADHQHFAVGIDNHTSCASSLPHPFSLSQ